MRAGDDADLCCRRQGRTRHPEQSAKVRPGSPASVGVAARAKPQWASRIRSPQQNDAADARIGVLRQHVHYNQAAEAVCNEMNGGTGSFADQAGQQANVVRQAVPP